MKLRLGTRGSDLALTQSRWVAAALGANRVTTELVTIATSGDRSAAPSFGAIGPQGVFVREIEQALLAREIDLAVHSYKDLPTASPPGLLVAAVPKRRDPADWLLRSPVARNRDRSPVTQAKRARKPLAPTPVPAALAALDAGARVGTASARRQAWLRHFRPDVEIAPLRGNVPTRIRRLADGDFDAILLAGAGIDRLNDGTDVLRGPMAGVERERLDPLAFVPAPAQGALAVQCRAGDADIVAAIAALDDADSRAAVALERAALALAEGGCDTAFGAHARATDGGTELCLMTERNGRILASRVTGSSNEDLAARAIAALVSLAAPAAGGSA